MDYFDYSETESFDIEEFLEESQSREQERIEEELETVEQELGEREQVHRSNVSELESKLDWYIDRLEDVYRRNGSREKAEKLKEEIQGFYEDLRVERRNKWRDIQELRQERRQLLRELSEVEDTQLEELF